MEVAGLAVWGGAQRRTKLTDEQVPFPLSTLAPALPLERGTIGPIYRHRPKPSTQLTIGHKRFKCFISETSETPETRETVCYDKIAPAMRMPRKMIIQRKVQSMSRFFFVFAWMGAVGVV